MNNEKNCAAALELAAADIPIFPALVSWNEKTQKLDKKPAISEWQAKATSEAALIKAWWAQFPNALPAIELGRAGLVVIDLDRHPGSPDGVTAFKALRNGQALPPQPATRTASNGYHLIFRQPSNGEPPLGNGRGNLPLGCDVRGRGGWIVAPGASCEHGTWRAVKDRPSLASAYKSGSIPELPQWLRDIIRPQRAKHSAAPSLGDIGKRERIYAERALTNAANKVAGSQRGSRNTELNNAAFCIGTLIARGWIGAATVEGRLHDAAAACGLLADDGERAARCTIKSAIAAGLKQPHDDLPNREWNPSEPSAEREAAKHWRDGLITAKALQTKTFAPVRIIVPGLIPEGVTIVAGKPKIGKSWLALDVCAAVAGDRFVLGQTKPVQGDVLYIALEDNQRRLKKRTDKILQGAAGWPEPLELHTEWQRVDQGGLDDIREWCEAHPARRLIWIDTFVKIRPMAGRNEQAYAFDYRAIEGLQKLAGEYQVGIVLNHHLRKMSSEDDAMDDVSGTLGLTGAADTIIVMKRQAGMVKIYVRGRDIEEAEFAAEFNKQTCRWRLVGEADEVFRSEQRQAIATALKGTARPMSVTEIMAATERRDRHSTEALLAKMERDGEVKHVGRGQWAHPDPTESVVIVGKERSGSGQGKQAFGNTEEISAAKTQRQTQRKHNASKTVVIPVVFPENANPLADKEKSAESQHHNGHNGSERADDYPELPECLRRAPNGGGNGSRPPPGNGWRLAGEHHQARARVWIKEVWPPALGPAGDDVFDIDPGL
jgi:AAA domain-containing protein/bifunctional DNA primase/polymerase-like protein